MTTASKPIWIPGATKTCEVDIDAGLDHDAPANPSAEYPQEPTLALRREWPRRQKDNTL